MWWIIIVVIFSGIIAYLLFAPFFIEVNTTTGIFRIRFHRLASAGLTFTEHTIFLHLNIAGWRKQWDVSQMNGKAVQQGQAQKPRRQKTRKRIPLRKMIAVARSFQAKRLFLTLDTGNMPLNGMLYPLFQFFSMKSGKTMTINFTGECICILQLRNTVARIMWAYIRS